MDVLCSNPCAQWRLMAAAPRKHGRLGQRFVVRMSSDRTVQGQRKPGEIVNAGIKLLNQGMVREALQSFDVALEMNPDDKVVQAIHFNKACCYAQREEYDKAAESLKTALRDYNLKFHLILNDPDLAPFRASKEFRALRKEAIKGGQDIGASFRRDLKLISEVRAPFRALRKFFYVIITVSAGIAIVLNINPLVRAIRGGEGAPGLLEQLGGLGINIAGIVVCVGLFIWDNKQEDKQVRQISRDETLSRLPVKLANGQIVDMVQLRQTTRPVILAGSKQFIQEALARAEEYQNELLKRGVLLIPLQWNRRVATSKTKGFGKYLETNKDAFQKRAEDVALKAVTQRQKRFVAEIGSQELWESWVVEQQKSEGLTPKEDVFIVLRLDGRIRKSGRGMPSWVQLLEDLPELETVLSSLEK